MSLKTSLQSFLKLSEIKDNAQAYIDTRVELAKMDIEEKAADAMAGIVYTIFKVTAGSLVTLLFLIMLAIFINQKTDSLYLGFGISLVISLIIFFLLVYFQPKFTEQIKRFIIKKIENQ